MRKKRSKRSQKTDNNNREQTKPGVYVAEVVGRQQVNRAAVRRTRLARLLIPSGAKLLGVRWIPVSSKWTLELTGVMHMIQNLDCQC